MGVDLPFYSSHGLDKRTSILLLLDAEGISLNPLEISMTAQ